MLLTELQLQADSWTDEQHPYRTMIVLVKSVAPKAIQMRTRGVNRATYSAKSKRPYRSKEVAVKITSGQLKNSALPSLECPKCTAQMRIIAFIQDEHSIKDIMKAQGIPDFQAPPPIPKFIDTAHAIDELPSYGSFEPSPDDF